jgi:glutamate/tyrosine decarboxylase-like PLP-dependent enzyme
LVELNVEAARILTSKLENSKFFRLAAPTRLNVVCFTLATEELTSEKIKKFLDIVQQDGRVFLTPTVYQGTPAIRAAFSNRRTQSKDIEIIWEALCETYERLVQLIFLFAKMSIIKEITIIEIDHSQAAVIFPESTAT